MRDTVKPVSYAARATDERVARAPPDRYREAVARTCNTGEGAPEKDVDVPIERDVDAHCVGRRRRFADGADVETEARSSKVEPDEKRGDPRRVHER